LGGYRLRVIGWDRRYDDYSSGDAGLLLKDDKFVLEMSKRYLSQLSMLLEVF
jgi:hypothetical protein